MSKEQRAVCSGGLVVEVAVLLKSCSSSIRVVEVVDELLDHGGVYLRMANDKESGRALPTSSVRSALKVGKLTWRRARSVAISAL